MFRRRKKEKGAKDDAKEAKKKTKKFGRRKKGTKDDEKEEDEKKKKKKGKKSKRGKDDSDDNSPSGDEDEGRGFGGSDGEGGRGERTRKKKKTDKGKEKGSKKKKSKLKGGRVVSDDSSSGDDEKGGGREGKKNRGKGKKKEEDMDKEKKSKRKKEKSKRGESDLDDSDDSSGDEEKGEKQHLSSGTDDEEEGSRRGGRKSRRDRKVKEIKKKNSKTGNEDRVSRREGYSYDPWSDEDEGGRDHPYKNKFRVMEDSYNSRSGRSFHDSWSHDEGRRERSRYQKSKSSGGEYTTHRPRPGTSSRRRRQTASSHSLQYDQSRSESLRKGARRGKERAHSQSDHQLWYGDPDEHLSQAKEGPGFRKTRRNEPHSWEGPSTVRTASLTKSTSRVDIDSMLHAVPEVADPLPRRMGPSPLSSVTRIVHVIAPKGKLGLVMDAAPDGTTCVCDVKKHSPIRHKVLPEDKIIAIDNVDVQMMSAVGISKLLARKCRQPQRTITVLREVEVQALTWRDSDLDVDAHFDDLSSFGSGMNNSAMF